MSFQKRHLNKRAGVCRGTPPGSATSDFKKFATVKHYRWDGSRMQTLAMEENSIVLSHDELRASSLIGRNAVT